MHKTKFRDAPIGLQNRCRIMKVVRDIERIEKKAEAEKLEAEKVERENTSENSRCGESSSIKNS